MKRILILGGEGFLGKNLNQSFAGLGFDIFNESRRSGCDLTSYSSTEDCLRRTVPDVIIHAAAHVGSIGYVGDNCATVVHDNTLMYINLYKSIAATNPNILVVNPISNCSYPGIIDIQHEENWWDGIIHESVESYGNPKKMGYIISQCYAKQYGIHTLNLIMANAYGPNDYTDENRTHAMNGIIMRMIRAQRAGDTKFSMWGSGSPIREWLYMPDMTRLLTSILTEDNINLPNPLNIGQERGVSILESVTYIKEALGYDVEIVPDTTKADGAPIKVLGSKKFTEHFPHFAFTPYEKGIAATINYYKEVL
jgi:GDP-L-fucose synthase